MFIIVFLFGCDHLKLRFESLLVSTSFALPDWVQTLQSRIRWIYWSGQTDPP